MGLSSLRVRALGAVEKVLRRWLGYVEDQLEPADPPQAPPDRQPFVARQPAPPDHWVELVRESAPQLLESAVSDDAPSGDTPSDEGLVIDYRAPDAPPTFLSSLPPVRPLSLAPARPLYPLVNPTHSVTPSSRRPLRLEPIRTQLVEREPLAAHPVAVAGETVEPPTVSTAAGVSESVRSVSTSVPHVEASRGALVQIDAAPVLPPTHRIDSTAEPTQLPLRTRYRELESRSVREVPTTPGENERIGAHITDLPSEPMLRAASTSAPKYTKVPIVRTREGGRASLNQLRTSVPPTSPQVTMQPTTVPAPLNIKDIQPERWPSLPESPAEDISDSRSEDRRREHLRREQEGRAWSE